MKKLILTIAITAVVSLSASAQGTVDFRNRVGSAPTYTVNAPVFDTDGTTLLAGPNYVAQLYFGTPGTAEGSLTAVLDPVAAFRTGAGAGFWNAGASFVRTLPGIAGGTAADLQVRVWDNTAFPGGWAVASTTVGAIVGKSGMFTQVTGDPGASPPTTPTFMVGLSSITVAAVVPEPSTFALGALGLAGLVLFRRRK